MGSEKKGVKRFKKGMEKAKKKFGTAVGQFNKGARSKPRPVEKEMEDVETPDNVMQVQKHRKTKSAADKVGSIKQHREELQKLEEMDPGFFDFLKQNDSSLLDFGAGDEEEDDEDLDEESEEDNESEEEAGDDMEEEEEDDDDEPKERPLVPVTAELLKSTTSSAVRGNFAALKKLLAIFRAACVPNGGKDVSSENLGDDDDEKQVISQFQIPSADIYQLVMNSVLEEAHKAFYAILDFKADRITRTSLESLSKHPKWKKMQLLVLSFYKSYMMVLGSVARGSNARAVSDQNDENSPAEVAVYLMQAVVPYVPLLTPLPRLSKALLKILLYIWAEGPNPTEDTQSLRARAYLRIRQMAMQLPGAYAEECFRCLYLTFTRVTKTFTEFNAASIQFMIRCVVELYQTDILQAYQQSFLYIRQLALHLRTAVLKKTSENVRQVTSWQFLNCIRLWTRVLCALPAEDELGALAFPLSQVIYGVMALAQSVYLLPLRFHLISCLQLLAAHCQFFIPTAQRLLEILELPELGTKTTTTTEVAPRLQFLVKFPADSVSRTNVRDAIVLESITLLRHDAEVYRFHVGFPEYSYLTTRKLRAFAKSSKVSKWRDMARTTASLLESYATEVKKHRVRLGKSPAEVKDFEPLLPGEEAPSAARLMKLLSGRGFTAVTEITVPSANASATVIGNKKNSIKAAPVVSSDESSEPEDMLVEDEEEDEQDDEDEEDDDEEEEEEPVVQQRKNAKSRSGQHKEDKVGKLNISSFFD